MRLAIVGQKWLAAELLARLVAAHDILYAAAPDRSDRLAKGALALAIPVVETAKKDWAAGLPPADLLIAAHAHVRIPDALLAQNRMNIGFHPSLLPLFRGKNAIADAIAAGQLVTGGTVYHLTGEIDGGPAIARNWCFIQPGDTAAGLWRHTLGPMGLEMLAEAAANAAAFERKTGSSKSGS